MPSIVIAIVHVHDVGYLIGQLKANVDSYKELVSMHEDQSSWIVVCTSLCLLYTSDAADE